MEKHRLFALLTLVTLLAAPLPGAGWVFAEQPPLPGAPPAVAEAGAGGDWWAAVQEEIRRSEYEITWQEETALPGVAGAYQAPNRAHNLRTYFTLGGPVVVPRSWADGAEGPAWRWGLRLTAWGSPGETGPTGAPALHPAGNRIEYRYPAEASIVEWYVNDERGLEQGFTLADPPGKGEGQVVLDLAVNGDLLPRLGPGGESVEYTNAAGAPVLSYAGLHAYDARGRSLPAHLALPSPGVLRVVIDASSAHYPVTVDPLVSAPGWRTEGNQDDAQWGTSVAFAGDLDGDGYDDLAIGAPYFDDGYADRGEIFVFYGSEAGPPANFERRIAGPSEGARLGEVVGPAGDVNGDGYDDLIASAPGDGYVAVYYGSATGPAGQWTATGAAADYFGSAAGTAGDVNGDGYDDAIVGAMNADPLAADSGAAYVWLGSADGLGGPGLPGNADWSGTSGQGGGRLGRSAGTAGDLNGDGYGDIVVGANGYDSPESDEGALFVWYGSADGLGSSGLPANADWSAQGNQDHAFLGTSAGTAGDVNGDGYDDLVAGAYRYSGDLTNAGRAYVFYGSAGGLACSGGCPVNANTAANWTADGAYEMAYAGAAAATAGDVDGDGYDEVVIGAPYDDSGQEDAGRAYLYRGSVTGLGREPAWSGGGGQEGELYGWSVSGAGDANGDGCDELLVGAPFFDRDQPDEGSAYLYYGSPLALLTEAAWSSLGGQKGAHLGAALDTAGDLNGDGFSDVVVGVPNLDNPTSGGRVLVYYGGAGGLPGTASWTATGDQGLAEFGGAVATAGDLNGDGYADLAIGAPAYDRVGLADAGAAFVYLGSAGGLGDPGTPSNADWAVYGEQAGAQLGSDVGTAGDVNRDGYDDLIAGAPLYRVDWGRAYVYHGSSDPDETPDWQADGPQPGGGFGFSVDTAGDVNRDGYADVIVGAPNVATAYLYLGGGDGLAGAPSWHSVNTQGDSRQGHAVAAAGDTNGDGYSDILIGAPAHDSNGSDRGRVYLCFGSSTLPTCTWLFNGSEAEGRFGEAVSTAGDVNGDGYADVIAGEPRADGQGRDAGQVFVFYGGADSPAMGHGWAVGGRAGARLGGAVGTAGDVNGDGYADVIAGSPNYSDAEMQEGQAAIYYGAAAGPGTAPRWTAQSTQADTLFGLAVGTAGDVNADGYADVIVGAPSYDGGETNEGAVFVYHGAAAGPGAAASWTGESNQADAEFGAAVGAAGDVNGDGYSDIVVGARRYDGTGTDDGRALAWYGGQGGLGPAGTPDNADWQFEGMYSSSYLGTVVGTAGDVNGDGFSDVVVSAPGFESALQDQGRVLVFHGSAVGLSGVAWEVWGEQAGCFLGAAAGTAGDVNGDGYADVVIGASDYSGSHEHEGRVYVYHGSADGLEATPAAVSSGRTNAYFGGSAGTAGDVNGDGFADVIVGARPLGIDQLYEGRAYIYYGSPTGILGGGAPWFVEGDQFGAYLGGAVGTAGDVNGDGYADVVVGADGYDAGEVDEGRVYIYLGSADGPAYQPDWTAEGNRADVHLGLSAGTAGDVNGDGFADVIAGSGGYFSGGDPDKQRAYVYYGNGNGGHADKPRQRTPNQEPLAPLGLSSACNAVGLKLNKWMPLGRGQVRLQWQVAPLGTPFDAASGVVSGASASWAETHENGLAIIPPFSEVATGLSSETAYHWRVRLLYEPGNRLGLAAGPWRHVPWNGWNEQDFRTPGCGAYLPLVTRGSR